MSPLLLELANDMKSERWAVLCKESRREAAAYLAVLDNEEAKRLLATAFVPREISSGALETFAFMQLCTQIVVKECLSGNVVQP